MTDEGHGQNAGGVVPPTHLQEGKEILLHEAAAPWDAQQLQEL